METIHPAATVAEAIGRLLIAAAVGAMVGVNRELQRKPAGLRTHALVGIGGALITLVSLALPSADVGTMAASVSRVMQGMVAGIGFIGGGVIMYRGDAKGVHGLTTAAAIWVVSAAGMAIGGGMWRIGVAAAALTLAVLAGGEYIDEWLHHRAQPPA